MTSSVQSGEPTSGAKPQGTPKLLGVEKVRCPTCGDPNLGISIHLVEVKFFGNVVIESGRCPTCGFLYRDVYLADYGEPKRYEVKVTKDSGDYLLVKSSSATVIIPELGIEITPGPAAQGYITTARGVLERVAELLSGACNELGESCWERLKEVDRALRGELDYTLILEDPLGKSTVVRIA